MTSNGEFGLEIERTAYKGGCCARKFLYCDLHWHVALAYLLNYTAMFYMWVMFLCV